MADCSGPRGRPFPGHGFRGGDKGLELGRLPFDPLLPGRIVHPSVGQHDLPSLGEGPDHDGDVQGPHGNGPRKFRRRFSSLVPDKNRHRDGIEPAHRPDEGASPFTAVLPDGGKGCLPVKIEHFVCVYSRRKLYGGPETVARGRVFRKRQGEGRRVHRHLHGLGDTENHSSCSPHFGADVSNARPGGTAAESRPRSLRGVPLHFRAAGEADPRHR